MSASAPRRACVALAALGIACARAPHDAPVVARAVLRAADGREVATAVLRRDRDALRFELSGEGLPDGAHGLHVHAAGRCDGPAFSSAGAHLSAGDARHGARNAQGPHAGDLPNVSVAGGRIAPYAATSRRLALRDGAVALFDADGSALVLHAAPDDERTDPSGNSGARLACGVLGAP